MTVRSTAGLLNVSYSISEQESSREAEMAQASSRIGGNPPLWTEAGQTYPWACVWLIHGGVANERMIQSGGQVIHPLWQGT
ncbi:MAG: hypothetical protein EXQ56_13410 [Acidobacteria bacterium]|nr:hypothetical protein [Acidobacteriota bacterium]